MRIKMTLFVLAALLAVEIYAKNKDEAIKPLPVVLWHGMGDSCCNPLSMGYIKKLIRTNLPGVYVLSLMLGANVMEDTEHGFFANMNEQVARVCAQLARDKRLADGYNAVGFSQGGLFVRALAQRCPNPPIRNLISIGGPQQGVFGLPFCPGSAPICNTVRHLLDHGAYAKFVQKTVVQAQYWHDPNLAEDYRHKNIFLADLNCELTLNATYRTNLLKLRNFLLVKFLRDQMIQPKESSWFGFYAENNTGTVEPMEETALYSRGDRVGLKALDDSRRLHFLAIDGAHLQIPAEVFIAEIIEKYLAPEKSPAEWTALSAEGATNEGEQSEEAIDSWTD